MDVLDCIDATVPAEYCGSVLTERAWLERRWEGIFRAGCMIADGRAADVTIPEQFRDSQDASVAYLEGQNTGYLKTITLHELDVADGAAQIEADWAKEGDVYRAPTGSAIRGGLLSALLALVVGLGLAGCGSSQRAGFYDGFNRKDGLPEAEIVELKPECNTTTAR